MATGADSERTPLLGPDGANINAAGSDSHATSAELPPTTRPISPAKRVLVSTLSFSLLIALAIGGTLYDTPITEIQEDVICRRIRGPDWERGACKDKDVQSELSFIRGWDTTFTLIPSLISSVPYGAMADRYGRTLVLGLSLLGITLSAAFGSLVCAMPHVFHPRAIWLSKILRFIGGGETIFSAMTYTIMADISSESQRATAFFYIGASLMGGALFANPIVYLAMKRGPWFSVFTGLVCLSVSTAIAFLIPETLDKTAAIRTSPDTQPTNAPPSTHDIAVPTNGDTTAPATNTVLGSASTTLTQQNTTNNDPPEPLGTPLSRIAAALTHTVQSIRFLFWDHKLVGFLLISLALEIFGRGAVFQLIQYAAKRYNMSYSEAGLLQSVMAFTSLVLLLVVLPGTSQLLLTKLRFSARDKDLRLAQVSAALSAAGTMLEGLAETKTALLSGIVIAGLGGGYTFMIRGLMTSLVGGHEIGLMYTSIAFVETLAALVSGPVFAGLFNVGLEWGDAWVGLPFVVGGWVLVIAAGLVGVISGSMIAREEKGDDGNTEEQEQGNE